MNKRLLLALGALILIAGGFQLLKAQQGPSTQRLQGAKPLAEQAPPAPGLPRGCVLHLQVDVVRLYDGQQGSAA